MNKPKTKYKTVVICWHTNCKFNKRQDTFHICSKKQISLVGHWNSDHKDLSMQTNCDTLKEVVYG